MKRQRTHTMSIDQFPSVHDWHSTFGASQMLPASPHPTNQKTTQKCYYSKTKPYKFPLKVHSFISFPLLWTTQEWLKCRVFNRKGCVNTLHETSNQYTGQREYWRSAYNCYVSLNLQFESTKRMGHYIKYDLQWFSSLLHHYKVTSFAWRRSEFWIHLKQN
jgi:hypothetical protein